ncbi:hypothetical protein SAMN05421810_111102 [Amycolatopsis arida]|uniref:Uncharacterized protein n=1 Tax=Amycolatopsis arida TaxID=587909 RepID=A0A1I6A5Z1_9PSEU|nr:hypothetical protein CLV69_111111 [Amycolatopsis arida]SFQ64052.1 hypothetical protein SAMN05421810_111102 [Amycolatopsis arida]
MAAGARARLSREYSSARGASARSLGPAAPVRAARPSPYDNRCPTHSSPLVPVDDGRTVSRIAADSDPDGECRAYAGSGPLD